MENVQDAVSTLEYLWAKANQCELTEAPQTHQASIPMLENVQEE